MARIKARFWETTALEDMDKAQWEALCDGCGKCCLIKLEDEDSGKIAYTNVACRLFEDATCRCANYPLRKQLVSGCVVLSPENIARNAYWMPQSCAYRRLFEGKGLPAWHPLVTGDPSSTQTSGKSMQNKTLAEYDIDEDELENYVIEGFK